MELKRLLEMGPWEWPEDTGERLTGILRDDQADSGDLLIAAELAGDYTVINDELAGILLDILGNGTEPDDLRATAAIALGPGLEAAYMFDDDDDDLPFPVEDDKTFSSETLHRIQQTLHDVFADEKAPTEVRRRVLEASVRSPQDWQRDAIRAAWEGDDEDWRLTAVFGMEYVRGFDQQILEALESGNEEICYHAVTAAGNWEVGAAWPQIVEILDDGEEDKDLLLAAFKAAATIRPNEASLVIGEHLDSDDDEIVDAAHEAIGMAQGLLDIEDDEGDWDDDADDSGDDSLVH